MHQDWQYERGYVVGLGSAAFAFGHSTGGINQRATHGMQIVRSTGDNLRDLHRG
jgi:hypothetical protein